MPKDEGMPREVLVVRWSHGGLHLEDGEFDPGDLPHATYHNASACEAERVKLRERVTAMYDASAGAARQAPKLGQSHIWSGADARADAYRNVLALLNTSTPAPGGDGSEEG